MHTMHVLLSVTDQSNVRLPVGRFNCQQQFVRCPANSERAADTLQLCLCALTVAGCTIYHENITLLMMHILHSVAALDLHSGC